MPLKILARRRQMVAGVRPSRLVAQGRMHRMFTDGRLEVAWRPGPDAVCALKWLDLESV